MKLVVPTSFQVLRVMEDGERQTAPNLAEILDRTTHYMNNQLSDLHGLGLVRRAGPSDSSQMYEITEKGRIALEHAEEYSHQSAPEFGELVGRILENRQKEGAHPDVPVSTIRLTDDDFELLKRCLKTDDCSGEELAEEIGRLEGIVEAGLDRLEAFKLLTEDERGWNVTQLGRLAIENEDVYEESDPETFTDAITSQLLIDERKDEQSTDSES